MVVVYIWISIIRGGESGTLPFFLNQLITNQHLANSGEAQLKKITLYFYSFFQPGSRPKVPGLQLLQLRPSTFSLHLQRFPTIQLFCCSLNNPDSIPNPHDVFYPQPSKTLCRKGNLQLGGRLPGRVPRESHDVTPPAPPPLHLSTYFC